MVSHTFEAKKFVTAKQKIQKQNVKLKPLLFIVLKIIMVCMKTKKCSIAQNE
jgi:hypothetical protein